MTSNSSSPALQFSWPLTNKEFTVSLLEPFGAERFRFAKKMFEEMPHGSQTNHHRSYVRNRLALVGDLCDMREPSGAFCTPATEMLAFTWQGREQLCRNACCRSDVLPLWYKFLRDKHEGGRFFTPIMEKFLQMCVHLDWFDWFAESQLRNSAASESEDGDGDGVPASKKRRLARTLLGAQDFTQHWNAVLQFLGLPTVSNVPLDFHSMQPVRVELCSPLTTFDVSPSNGDIALANGLLPPSVGVKFAASYMRASRIGAPCLIRAIDSVFIVNNVPIFKPDNKYSEELPFLTPLAFLYSSLRNGSTFFLNRLRYNMNFGLNQLQEERTVWNAGVLFAGDLEIVTLLRHVKSLATTLTWSDLVELRGDKRQCCLLNELLFLAPENIYVSRAGFHLSPNLNIRRGVLPSAEFVRRHDGNVPALLSNNFARLLYSLITGREMPDTIGLEFDDEDGTSRTAFMFHVNPFTVSGTCLNPRQMHCLACLYFGDFKFDNEQHTAALIDAFGAASDWFTNILPSGVYYNKDLLDSTTQFAEYVLRNHFADRPQMVLTNDSDGRDLALQFCQKLPSYPLLEESIPYLKFHDSQAHGQGPHVDAARRLFLSACRHENFFLEIDAGRRRIVPRRNRSLTCRICSADVSSGGGGDNAPCIFTHDEELLATSRAIASECILMRIDLPVTLSFAAIVAILRIRIDSPELAVLLEYADSGPLAQRLSTLSMDEHNQFVLTATTSRGEEPRLTQFVRSFLGEFNEKTMCILYGALNRSMPFERKRPVAEIDVGVAREVVFRLCQFTPSKVPTEFFDLFANLRRSIGNNPARFADYIRTLDSASPTTGRALRAIVAKHRENRALWSFFGWLQEASLADLCALVQSLGSDPALIAVYAQDNMPLVHTNYLLNAERRRALEDYDCQLETLLDCRLPDWRVEQRDTGRILDSDRIAVCVSARDSEPHIVRVATCFRTLTLRTDTRPSQLAPSLRFLLDRAETYNAS